MNPASENGALRGKASWIAYAVLLSVAIWLLAETFAPLWQPLLVAAVLAGTSHGWHRALARRLGERPRLAASIMTVALVLLVLVPFALIGTVLVQQALEAVDYVREALRQGGIEELSSRLPDRIEAPVRDAVDRLPIDDESLSSSAAAGGWTLARLARDVLEGASRAIFGLVMLLIAYFALLLDGRRLVAWVERALPLPVRHTGDMFAEFRRVSRSVLGSTLVSAAAQAVVAGIGYAIAGVPNVLFFSAITGLVALIPIVGTPLVSLPLAGLLLATGQIWQAIFLAAYSVLVVSTVDNVVKPMVVRGGMQLNSALVFFSLLGGLLAFGAIGLVVGPLAVTFFLAMVRLRKVAGTDVAQPDGSDRRRDIMEFERLDPPQWKALFDRASRVLAGVRAEVEVVGPDIGDQLEANWLPLVGISYDPHDRDIVIHLEGIDHRIADPQDVYLDREGPVVRQLVIIDGEGHKQFIRFSQPLELPAPGDTTAPAP